MKELSPESRELVHAGKHATDPSDADKERNLIALRAQIAAAPAPSSPEPGAATAASKPSWLLLSGAAAGGALIASLFFLAGNDERPSGEDVSPPAATVEQAPASKAESSEAADGAQPGEPANELEVAAPVEPIAASPEASASGKPKPQLASSPASNDLAAEVALLSQATSALRAGRATEALRSLAEHQKRFPRGALGRERKSARAQALCQLGRKDEARAVLRGLPSSSALGARARRACKFE